jgi:hypothetical protein
MLRLVEHVVRMDKEIINITFWLENCIETDHLWDRLTTGRIILKCEIGDFNGDEDSSRSILGCDIKVVPVL